MEPIYIADYNYPLPDERIAKYPLAERDSSKLLVYKPIPDPSLKGREIENGQGDKGQGSISEDRFYNVGEHILPEGLLIYNNTRVIQARLEFHKKPKNEGLVANGESSLANRESSLTNGESNLRNGEVKQGARIEVFCLEPLEPRDYQLSLGSTKGCVWKCMVGNAKKWHTGDALELKIKNEKLKIALRVHKEEVLGNTYAVRFEWDDETVSFAEILDAAGELPIPPYLNRKTEESDLKTYQTVYSRIKGSVAAPTAGLHFTERVLEDIRKRGIETDEVTLHVGAGTFLPVKTADANEHTMHTEIIAVPKSTIEHIIAKLGKIVAVGTTSMRTLESLYFIGKQIADEKIKNEKLKITNLHVGQFEPYQEGQSTKEMSTKEALEAIVDYLTETGQETLHAETQIMIKPGYKFHVVDQLITNFHQPQSTLLLLVSAFVDGDWKRIYEYALGHNFRFLSYGDSSILTKGTRHVCRELDKEI